MAAEITPKTDFPFKLKKIFFKAQRHQKVKFYPQFHFTSTLIVSLSYHWKFVFDISCCEELCFFEKIIKIVQRRLRNDVHNLGASFCLFVTRTSSGPFLHTCRNASARHYKGVGVAHAQVRAVAYYQYPCCESFSPSQRLRFSSLQKTQQFKTSALFGQFSNSRRISLRPTNKNWFDLNTKTLKSRSKAAPMYPILTLLSLGLSCLLPCPCMFLLWELPNP